MSWGTALSVCDTAYLRGGVDPGFQRGGRGGTVQHHFVRSACFQIKFSESVGGTGLLRPPGFGVLLMNTVYVEADSVVNSLSCM